MILVSNCHVTLARADSAYNAYVCLINDERYSIDRAQADAIYALSVQYAAHKLSDLIYKSEVIMTLRSNQVISN